MTQSIDNPLDTLIRALREGGCGEQCDTLCLKAAAVIDAQQTQIAELQAEINVLRATR